MFHLILASYKTTLCFTLPFRLEQILHMILFCYILTLSRRAKTFENIKNWSTFWILFHNLLITYANIWKVYIFEITIKRPFICNYSFLVIELYDVIDLVTFKVIFTIFFDWIFSFLLCLGFLINYVLCE